MIQNYSVGQGISDYWFVSKSHTEETSLYLHNDLTWHRFACTDEYAKLVLSGKKRRRLKKYFPGNFSTKSEAMLMLAKMLRGEAIAIINKQRSR